MNESIHRAQVTIRAMKMMVEALEDLGQQLPKNPRLYAILAESPMEDLRRLRDELDHHFEQIKHGSNSSVPVLDNPIPSPTAPGPVESAS